MNISRTTATPNSATGGFTPSPSTASPLPAAATTPTSTTSNPAVLSFFILYCEGKTRAARSLFQEELIKPAPGSRQISLDDFQTVVRDLVVNQELFDSMLRPIERPSSPSGGTMLPQGRSFKCLRGATFALHQFCSGTGIRFFLMTDPNFNSTEAQRKLAAIYSGPFVDLVVRNESISLRDLLNEPPKILSGSEAAALQHQQQQQSNSPYPFRSNRSEKISSSILDDAAANNNTNDAILKTIIHSDQPAKLVPVLPRNIQQALRSEVLAILRGV